MPGQSIRIQPKEFTKEQHHRVGISVPDQWNRLWTYCMFPGGSSGTTYNKGELLADSLSADLLGNSGVGTLTEAQAVGSNLIKDTDEFASDDFRGAIGIIDSNEGIGQVFQVLRVVDKDTLEIALLFEDDGKSGWKTALVESSSTYELMFPGRVKKVPTTGLFAQIYRGFIQEVLTVPANESRYGWALQQGLGVAAHDSADTAPVAAAFLAAGDTTPGNIEGAELVTGTAPNTVAALLAAARKSVNGVGRSPFGITLTADGTVPIYADIRNNMLSYRFPVKDEPYSRDDNGDLIL